jgi:cardiolipin synthase (CMP-forming)
VRIFGAGTRRGFEYTVRDTFWTVPNVVTVLRFLLIPIFVYLVGEGEHMPAVWVLVALGATDWLDGFIARFFNQMSTVGRWLDPLADRLAMIVVTLTLVHAEIAPGWLLWAILIPDLVLLVNSVILFAGSPQLSVSGMGRVRTASLMISLPLLLLAELPEFAEYINGLFPLIVESFLVAAAVMHIIASIDYLVQALGKFRRLRAANINPWRRSTWARIGVAAPPGGPLVGSAGMRPSPPRDGPADATERSPRRAEQE